MSSMEWVGKCMLGALLFGSLWTSAIAAPEWEQDRTIDTSAFRTRVEVPVYSGPVPVVLEIPVPPGYVENERAVALDGAGGVHVVRYMPDRTHRDTPVVISGTGESGDPAWLLDRVFDTAITFPAGTTELTFGADVPLVSTELRFVFASGSARPELVSVRAEEENGSTLVYPPQPLSNDRVRFAEQHVRTYVVSFVSSQPYTIAEAHVVEHAEDTWKDALRFVATPGETYHILVDPDRSFGMPDLEEPNLMTDEGVRVVEGRFEQNPAYRPLDTDHDGVPDQNDNCLSISNPNQEDLDRNARGDACDDFDRDSIANANDNCTDDPNWDQIDTDQDGVGDVCDTVDDRFSEQHPWVPWVGIAIAASVLIGFFVAAARMQRRATNGDPVV